MAPGSVYPGTGSVTLRPTVEEAVHVATSEREFCTASSPSLLSDRAPVRVDQPRAHGPGLTELTASGVVWTPGPWLAELPTMVEVVSVTPGHRPGVSRREPA
jgi:hypothetical protein